MTNDLEFAIKQDVRNNPVVREVDLDQKREFIRMLGWAALGVGMLLVSLWPRASVISLAYKVELHKQELAAEKEWQRQYRMQLELVSRAHEIRRRAISELHMIDAPPDAVLALEVVPSHTPASRAIVASNR
jgi:hypothetical protein